MAKEIKLGNIGQLFASLIKKRSLVVDIGSSAIKVLEVTKKGKNVSIDTFLEMDNVEKYFSGKDLSNFEGMTQDLKRVLKIAEIKSKKVDIVYNSNQLQSKIIKVPMMSEKDVRDFVEIEYHKSFANISPIGNIMDYLPLGVIKEEDRTELSILLATLPVGESTKLMKVFEAADMQVDAIETNVHALGNALNLVETKAEYKLILHMGKEYSIILFSKGDVPTFYRVFSFGYNQLARSIQEELKTSLSNVDKAIKNLGLETNEHFKTDIDQDTFNFLIKDGINNFMNEVYRSINYVKMNNTKFEADKIYLSGGMAELIGIEEYTEDILNIPAKKWIFKEDLKNDSGITIKGKENLGPTYALALGLAVRGWM